MELILQKDVKNLGKAGDRVRVKPGYGRNYLLPNKLALLFDEKRSKEWKHKKQVIEFKKRKAFDLRKKSLEKLSSVHLVFEKESRPEGTLFGSVSPFDISKKLGEEDISIDKKDIKTSSLKEVGVHKVAVELGAELKTEITVEIKKKISKKEGSVQKSKGFFFRLKKSIKKEEKPSEIEESLKEEKESGEDSPPPSDSLPEEK